MLFLPPPHANLKVTYDSFHLNNISGIFLEIEAIGRLKREGRRGMRTLSLDESTHCNA